MDISSEMVHSLLPIYLVVHLNTSTLTLGIIEGIAESAALMVKVFSGALSDYFGKRKPLAVFGYGLSALSKPLFAIATTIEIAFSARLIDRLGKGIRGAPRDALIADVTPKNIRGAAYGLRQSMDTVGAFAGPLIAMALMLLWDNQFLWVFWVATIPGFLAVSLLMVGLREPSSRTTNNKTTIHLDQLTQLTTPYWWVVGFGSLFTLARFSEAFILLSAQQRGLPIAYAPLIMVAMSFAYALSAYPFGKLADRMRHTSLLAGGILTLIGADLIIATSHTLIAMVTGVLLWGIHLGMTQGLLATMVSHTVPAQLRGTGFGIFNLVSGLSMLFASILAGWIWQQYGAAYTYYAGALFCLFALAILVLFRIIEDNNANEISI